MLIHEIPDENVSIMHFYFFAIKQNLRNSIFYSCTVVSSHNAKSQFDVKVLQFQNNLLNAHNCMCYAYKVK